METSLEDKINYAILKMNQFYQIRKEAESLSEEERIKEERMYLKAYKTLKNLNR